MPQAGKTRPKARKEPMMRISAAAKAAGVGKQTIEYYIMLGLIVPIRQPGRRGRYFDKYLVRRIRLIRRLNKEGIPLRGIRELFHKRLVARKGPGFHAPG